jgi:transcriptional regulator with XRE-family HTH domain
MSSGILKKVSQVRYKMGMFSAKLKKLRADRKLSQSDLAKRCGVPIHTLRNWEAGRRLPDLVNAAKLARALKVSLDVLGAAALSDRKDQETSGEDDAKA